MNLAEIHARMKAATAVARLPLRSGRWSGTAGTVLGRGTGSSLDFQDHRQYVPGDDPRHINWQAYARTGHYTMKLYREEVTPRIDLVYDMSGSMFLDAPKERRAWELFTFCLESGLRIGGHLKLYLLGRSAAERPTELPVQQAVADDWPAVGPARTQARVSSSPWKKSFPELFPSENVRFSRELRSGHLLHEVPQAVSPQPASSPRPPTEASQPLLADQLDLVPFRAGSLRVLVSDLLDASPPGRAAAVLSAGGSQGIVLAPFTHQESEPDWSGTIEFEDAERFTRRRQQVDGDLLARYRQAYRRHFGVWREACARRGVGFARVASGGDFLAALRGEAVPAGAIEIGTTG